MQWSIVRRKCPNHDNATLPNPISVSLSSNCPRVKMDYTSKTARRVATSTPFRGDSISNSESQPSCLRALKNPVRCLLMVVFVETLLRKSPARDAAEHLTRGTASETWVTTSLSLPSTLQTAPRVRDNHRVRVSISASELRSATQSQKCYLRPALIALLIYRARPRSKCAAKQQLLVSRKSALGHVTRRGISSAARYGQRFNRRRQSSGFLKMQHS